MSGASRVPLQDLRRQHDAIAPVLESAAVAALRSGHYVLGGEVGRFERKLATRVGCAEAVGVASGTDAISLALLAQDVGAGDEVVTSASGAAPTAVAIARTGATPVFCDVEPDTLTLDAESLKGAVTPRTRAVVPVHLYGHPADVTAVGEVARQHGLCVVEDCAQAIDARWCGRSVGAHGAAGAFSFYPTKNLGAAGDAGAVVTDDAALAERLRALRNYGLVERQRLGEVGFNSRLDEVQAALLSAKLPSLSSWTERRREIAARYALAWRDLDLRLPVERADARAVHHLFVVRTPRRDALRTHLAERGIDSQIHYAVPLHHQPPFVDTASPVRLPVAERAAEELLSLPLFPELREDEIERVIAEVRGFFAR